MTPEASAVLVSGEGAAEAVEAHTEWVNAQAIYKSEVAEPKVLPALATVQLHDAGPLVEWLRQFPPCNDGRWWQRRPEWVRALR